MFYKKKKLPGCYVKVYSTGGKGKVFYRDGYTDINVKFKYALADLEGIQKFAISTITKQGGIISRVVTFSKAGFY